MPASKILMVDDNDGDIALLRLALDEHGEEYELLVLNDGEKAIQFVEEQRLLPAPGEPCVILLDLRLPKRDGLEVLRAIRRSPVVAHIHVMLLTTAPRPQDQDEIRAMGAYYRTKPRDLGGFATLAAEVIAICNGLSPVEA